jgi:hypothetical protein
MLPLGKKNLGADRLPLAQEIKIEVQSTDTSHFDQLMTAAVRPPWYSLTFAVVRVQGPSYESAS